jgi:MscS family membrane protein
VLGNDVEFTLEYLGGLPTYQQIIVGLCASIGMAVLVRYFVWGPIRWVVGRTDIEWDNELLDLATPLFNYSVFLAGVYVTILLTLDTTSTVRTLSATFLVVILLFMSSRFLSKSVSRFLPSALDAIDQKLDADISGMTGGLTAVLKIGIWTSAALIVLDTLAVDITAALASLTILSLVIGMAMQESASNLIISAQLLIDRPFQIGDKIQIGTLVGVVAEIGFLTTKVKTPNEHLVIIPNKIIAGEQIINFARGGPGESPRRVNLRQDFGVSYGESPSHVKQVLREIVEDCDLIIDDPAPRILFTHMMDSSLTFRLNCWVGDYSDEWVARDILLTRVLNRFNEEGIEIPYPHMQLKYEALDEEKAKREAAEKMAAEASKEQRKAEAKIAEKIEQEELIERRRKMRFRMDELREQLDDEELEDEQRVELASELLEIEETLSLSADN